MNIRTVYETRPPSAGPRPTRKLRAWRWRLTVLGVAIVTAVLGACGSPPAPVPQEVLDCEAQGYACTYAEVDLAVIERSMSLAAAVAELLDAGGSLEDGLALLEAEPDVASYGAGDTGIVFRLVGGRPVVVDLTIEEFMLGQPSVMAPAASRQPMHGDLLAASAAAARTGLAPAMVTGAGRGKSALVLAPFAFDFGEQDTAATVAGMLASHPQYDGRVKFMASTSSTEPMITVDSLLDLDTYDVVYMTTHGGSLCIADKKKDVLRHASELGAAGQDGEPLDCRTDFLVQRFNGTAADLKSLEHVGIVLYQGRKYRSIAVTNDFFSHYYPNGLEDTLFVLVSCSTFAPDFNPAVAGGKGVYVSWDTPVAQNATWASASLIENLLMTGATVGRAMTELGDAVVDPLTGARMRSTGRREGGDLRIIDVVYASDALSGDEIQHAVEIELDGTPGDGEPDSIALEVGVLGAYGADAAKFRLRVSVNGKTHVDNQVHELLQQQRDYEWSGVLAINLGRDVQTGERLDIRVWVTLPEGGISEVQGEPLVGEPLEGLGTTWAGTLEWSSTTKTGGISYEITAYAVFELPAGADPNAPYPQYSLVGGTYSFSADGMDALNCHVSAAAGGDLQPQGGTYIRFDRTGAVPIINAFGNSGTPPTEAQVTCENFDDYTLEMSTSKLFLYIPSSLAQPVSGTSSYGNYTEESSVSRTSWSWSLSRVD